MPSVPANHAGSPRVPLMSPFGPLGAGAGASSHGCAQNDIKSRWHVAPASRCASRLLAHALSGDARHDAADGPVVPGRNMRSGMPQRASFSGTPARRRMSERSPIAVIIGNPSWN